MGGLTVILAAAILLALRHGAAGPTASESLSPYARPDKRLEISAKEGEPGDLPATWVDNVGRVMTAEAPDREEPAMHATSAQPSRMEDRIRRLNHALQEFGHKKGLVTASNVLQQSVVAWSDYFGTTITWGEGDPTPEQILTDDQWTLSVADGFGGHSITYSRVDFPECWELRGMRVDPERKMFDLTVDPDLLQRIEERARLVLETVSGD